MSKSFSINADFDWRDAMSDIGLRYADVPVYRIGFAISDPDVQTLADAYRDQIFRARHKADGEELKWATLVLRFADNTFVMALGDGRGWAEIFAPTAEAARTLREAIAKLLAANKPAEAPFFYMLRYEGDFYTERVEQLPDDPGDEFIELCYGNDILQWMDEFRERTTSRTGGLTILEGPPGTGKTSLVALMMRRLQRSHVFYVLPTAQGSALSEPELVPFWEAQNKRHPDRVKVIVIEDAERLLWPRTEDNRDAVSTVLNIADGLVGRMLRLHLLCSVNASLTELDPAIMRPGRLMNQRSFGPLSPEAARRIAELRSVPFEENESEPYYVADVLNPGSTRTPAKPRIGFCA